MLGLVSIDKRHCSKPYHKTKQFQVHVYDNPGKFHNFPKEVHASIKFDSTSNIYGAYKICMYMHNYAREYIILYVGPNIAF